MLPRVVGTRGTRLLPGRHAQRRRIPVWRGDQAFYLPAVHRHLAPESFPRDRLIIDDQDRLNVFTTASSRRARHGRPGGGLFPGTYVASLVLLFGAARLAAWLGLSRWARLAAWRRSRSSTGSGMTGANRLEGYGHPRVLAFAIGLWAVVSVARAPGGLSPSWPRRSSSTRRRRCGSGSGSASRSSRTARRPWLTAAAAGAAALPPGRSLRARSSPGVVMDAEWLGVVGGKDYLFPDAWPPAPGRWPSPTSPRWPAVRVRAPATGRRAARTALVAGLAALLFVFAATLPRRGARGPGRAVPGLAYLLDVRSGGHVVRRRAGGRRPRGTPAASRPARARDRAAPDRWPPRGAARA